MLINVYTHSYRDALLLALNAFANVRLKPLQCLTVDNVKRREDNGPTVIYKIQGQFKTGRNCLISLPSELSVFIVDFCNKLQEKRHCADEQKVLVS